MAAATNPMNAYSYVGQELELFKDARNWKRYFAGQISPFIRGDVLEVGAGIGSSTCVLFNADCTSWTCLEPDASLGRELQTVASRLRNSADVAPTVVLGTLSALGAEPLFDTMLYIDCLEHIEGDRNELAEAFTRLRPGGCLVVLSPAHQWLYTPFDRAIGHYRRYSAQSLRACSPRGATLDVVRYLDAAGMTASLANRLIMRASTPTPRQLAVWDRGLVPVSRVLDRMLGYRVGKSLLAVWRKPDREAL